MQRLGNGKVFKKVVQRNRGVVIKRLLKEEIESYGHSRNNV